jgi:hypothetical protein
VWREENAHFSRPAAFSINRLIEREKGEKGRGLSVKQRDFVLFPGTVRGAEIFSCAYSSNMKLLTIIYILT